MAWAVQRADGTYRAYSLAKDIVLREGEVYVEVFSRPTITADSQGVDAVRDAYLAAEQAVQALATDATIPAVARQAVVKLGLCVKALLIYLNRRVT